MDIQYTYIPFKTVAQAVNYGEDDYGDQVYSCEDGVTDCVAETSTGTAPNTGFMGMSQDTALSAVLGGALILIALVVGIIIAVSRNRKQSKKG